MSCRSRYSLRIAFLLISYKDPVRIATYVEHERGDTIALLQFSCRHRLHTIDKSAIVQFGKGVAKVTGQVVHIKKQIINNLIIKLPIDRTSKTSNTITSRSFGSLIK